MGVTKLKLSEEEIRSIVKSSFPEQTLKEYTELTEGYCNTAYRLVLDDGQIVGCGSHEQLLENCEAYQEIAKSQLSEAELKGGLAS